jgi:hypothetical protein
MKSVGYEKLNGAAAMESVDFMVSKVDEFGSPTSYNHYSVGWAHALDTPYQWTKQVASHWGGTRNGTIVHWPKGIKAKDVPEDTLEGYINMAVATGKFRAEAERLVEAEKNAKGIDLDIEVG